MSATIEVRELSRWYGEIVGLSNASLEIAPGAPGAEVSIPQKPASASPTAQLPARSISRTWTYQAPSPSVAAVEPVPAASATSIVQSTAVLGLPSITTE